MVGCNDAPASYERSEPPAPSPSDATLLAPAAAGPTLAPASPPARATASLAPAKVPETGPLPTRSSVAPFPLSCYSHWGLPQRLKAVLQLAC
ncbi:hypothetical protein WJX72_005576 [[Myrmecia] bisecta]|uniref:Uncharacterized protein n=1 Tax=[Myrmecia] bisecta TaxID=41462 RepID=A0AAW1QF65_9CHLO